MSSASCTSPPIQSPTAVTWRRCNDVFAFTLARSGEGFPGISCRTGGSRLGLLEPEIGERPYSFLTVEVVVADPRLYKRGEDFVRLHSASGPAPLGLRTWAFTRVPEAPLTQATAATLPRFVGGQAFVRGRGQGAGGGVRRQTRRRRLPEGQSEGRAAGP